MPENIAIRIKQRRKELGLSQIALAKSCGVGQPTVANWEGGGHTPRQASIHKIAAALEIDEVWLLTGEHQSDRDSLNRYLMRPIRHVAVFDWPYKADTLQRSAPKTYIAVTALRDNMFALQITADRDGFKANTTLIFSPDYNAEEPGVFLNLVKNAYSLSPHHSEDSQARLVYSLTPH
ncbi:helix-turn-helix domain-containing protein [Hellea sp.]|nr:helix-turn-helix domain-containing protein [Hellea sp.]